MNKKVLIVGGSGYIGGQIAYNNPDWDVYDSLLFEKYFYLPNKFIFGDVRDTNKLSKILKNYDVVIWLAGIVGDGACNLNPLLTREVNEYSVKWLVDNYDGRIVFASTCSVYGASDEVLNESSKLNPLSLYAQTKINSEEILSKHKNNIVLRFGTIFGHSLRPRFDLVVNTLTAHAYVNKKIKVFGGDQWRPNVHVKDVAKAVSIAAESDKNGTYNVANENLKIIDIAEKVLDNLPETEMIVTESPFEDQRNYKVDSSLIKSKLGWSADYDVDYGVKQMLDLLVTGRVPNPFEPVFHNLNYLASRIETNEKLRYGN